MINIRPRYWFSDPKKKIEVTRTREAMFEILKNSSDCLNPNGVRPGDIGPVEICKDLPHGSVVLDNIGRAWTVGRTKLGSRLLRVDIQRHQDLSSCGEVHEAHMYESEDDFTQEHLEKQELMWGSRFEDLPDLQSVHDSSEFLLDRVMVITVGKACLGDMI